MSKREETSLDATSNTTFLLHPVPDVAATVPTISRSMNIRIFLICEAEMGAAVRSSQFYNSSTATLNCIPRFLVILEKMLVLHQV